MLASDGSDNAVVARAVRCAAERAGVPVVARTRPGARGARQVGLGPDPAAARDTQRSAAAAYLSQSEALPEVQRRLELLDGREALRWLVPPPPGSRPATGLRARRFTGRPSRSRA